MDGCANGFTTMGLNMGLHTGNFLLKCRPPSLLSGDRWRQGRALGCVFVSCRCPGWGGPVSRPTSSAPDPQPVSSPKSSGRLPARIRSGMKSVDVTSCSPSFPGTVIKNEGRHKEAQKAPCSLQIQERDKFHTCHKQYPFVFAFQTL